LAEYERSMSLDGTSTEFTRALRTAFEKEGWKGFWTKKLNTDLERARHEYVSPYRIATYYTLLGHKENAFRYLDKAYADHDDLLTSIKSDRDFDSLHTDSRYASLLRRMRLPQ